jgi:hypothetical protein
MGGGGREGCERAALKESRVDGAFYGILVDLLTRKAGKEKEKKDQEESVVLVNTFL